MVPSVDSNASRFHNLRKERSKMKRPSAGLREGLAKCSHGCTPSCFGKTVAAIAATPTNIDRNSYLMMCSESLIRRECEFPEAMGCLNQIFTPVRDDDRHLIKARPNNFRSSVDTLYASGKRRMFAANIDPIDIK